MNRKEQIQTAADNYFGDDTKEQSPCFYAHIRNAFLDGVEWADQHPNWISVKDDLPKHDTNENGHVSFPMVLVCLYDGYRDTSYYDDIGEEWGDYDGEVEYWMPMPPAPAKED